MVYLDLPKQPIFESQANEILKNKWITSRLLKALSAGKTKLISYDWIPLDCDNVTSFVKLSQHQAMYLNLY